MANQWFRMYAEFATDPKVQMLSEADQRRYLMLLCIRCSNDDETLHETMCDSNVAFQLRISDEEWTKTKAILLSKKLIDKHNLPAAWDKRQYKSDNSYERVKAYRERKKSNTSGSETPNETLQKRIDNDDVTPPDTETDTDTDTEKRESAAKASPSARTDPPEKPITEKHRAKGVTKAQMRESFPDLTDQTIDDWITARKGKGAKTLTLTAWNAVVNEIRISGLTGEQALQIAAARNWQGIKSEWLLNHISGSHGPPARAPVASAVSRNAIEIQAWLESHGDERH